MILWTNKPFKLTKLINEYPYIFLIFQCFLPQKINSFAIFQNYCKIAFNAIILKRN